MASISQKRSSEVKRNIFFYAIFFVIFLQSTASSCNAADSHNDNSVSMSDAQGSIRLEPFFAINRSFSNNTTINDILASRDNLGWAQNTKSTISLGITSGEEVWFATNIQNQSLLSIDFILEIPNPYLDWIEVYVVADGKLSRRFSAGDKIPYQKWPTQNYYPVFPLPIASDSAVTIYLKVKTNGSLNLPCYLWRESTYNEHNNHAKILDGIYFGFILAMSIYNIFIYLFVKDKSYLFYFLYFVFFGLYQAGYQGIAQYYLWPDNIWFRGSCTRIFVFCTLGFSHFFTLHVLNLNENLKRMASLFKFSGLSFFILGPLTIIADEFVTSILLHHVVGAQWLVYGLIIIIMQFFCASFLAIQGHRTAILYLAGWLVLLTSFVSSILNRIGIVEFSGFVQFGMQIGSVIEAMLFSIALADRLNIMRNDKMAALSQVTDKNQQIEHILNATKEMSKAKGRFATAATALRYMILLDKCILPKSAFLYLTNKSRESFIAYRLMTNGQEVSLPFPEIVESSTALVLAELTKTTLNNGKLSIVIQSNTQRLGIVIIENYLNERLSEISMEVIEGLANSLALMLENITSEENSRLSGIGTMAASIVHDLKNPIGAIMGYADMATEDKLPAEKRKEYLRIIHREAGRMSTMAHEVLEFSRGELMLVIKVVDSEDFIDDVAKTLLPIFANHNMTFNARVLYHGCLELDDEHIRRVILNLAINAHDAMLSKGTPDAAFHLSIQLQNQDILIIAKDNGPGIPEHIRATLFEPFVTYGKANGTGLGMAIVKKIIDAHRGSIRFDTKLDEGTVFTITLPQRTVVLNQSNEQFIARNKLSLPPEVQTNGRILLLEDGDATQQMIVDMLTSAGYQVTAFTDAEHLFADIAQYCNINQYDLGILDMNLLNIKGTAVAEKLRKSGATFPLLAITANDDMNENQLKPFGFETIVRKPFAKETLLAKLKAIKLSTVSGAKIQAPQTSVSNKANTLAEKLAEHAEQVGKEKVVILIGLIHKSLDKNYLSLSNAFENQDMEEIHESIHSFKGLCDMFGIENMLPVLAEINDFSMQNDQEKLRQGLIDVAQLIDFTKQTLEQSIEQYEPH